MSQDERQRVDLPRPAREEEALREVGRTAISRPVAWALPGLFAVIVAGVLAVDLARGLAADEERDGFLAPFSQMAEGVSAAVEEWWSAGWLAGNRRLLVAIERFEDGVEEASVLRRWLLPPVQAWSLEHLGLGTERVVPGRGGWLFYRADVDHVVGPPFLDEAVLEGRRRGGDAWRRAPRPDPLPAIVGFRDQLAARGVELILVPTPVKPTVHPERLMARFAADGGARAAVRNASFAELERRLAAAAVPLWDPAPLLVSLAGRSGPAYLATDTHWTPEAVERVAAELAAELERRFDLPPPAAGGPHFFRRRSVAEGPGDVTAMLRLPEGSELRVAERVELAPVLTAEGRPWAAERGAPVLLLGDSFTNVYSDPQLGLGAGAGLAEQLAYHLDRPLDRIALNAGGAHAAREALARSLAAGEERLSGVSVVVWQFAARELSQGDWRRVELPE